MLDHGTGGWWQRLRGSFLVQVALAPVLVLALFGALFQMGGAALHTQQRAMTAVVETDLESSARLARINSRLQAANTEIYRAMTEAAANGDAAAQARRILAAGRDVEAITADLQDYRDGPAPILDRHRLDGFVDDLKVYKDAIEWIGSMLEIDFKTSVAFLVPYNAHVDQMSRELTAIIGESTTTAKQRAEEAAGALRHVVIYYAVAAALVSVVVALFGYAGGKRQKILHHAARQKARQVEELLDNSGQGFLYFGADLIVADEHSRACEQMFGASPTGQAADSLLFPAPADEEARQLMRSVVARAAAAAGDPDRQSIVLSLLPAEVALNGKILAVDSRPLEHGRIMLVLTDVTEARELACQVERERRRLEMIVAAVTEGRDLFAAVDEFRRFCRGAEGEADLDTVYREIHTFKGTFSQFGFPGLPAWLHQVEARLQELKRAGDAVVPDSLRAVLGGDGPQVLEADLAVLAEALGPDFVAGGGMVRLSAAEAAALEAEAARLAAVSSDAQPLLDRLRALRLVSLKAALAGFEPLVQRVAERCEKEVAPLEVSGDDALVEPQVAEPFLRVLGHVFRNAVDHGIEDPETRVGAGKDEAGRISCVVRDEAQAVTVEVADDGAGIDRAALSRAAAVTGEAGAGLDAAFADGVSTRATVSELSGRGVGLAAVRAVVHRLGGSVGIDSEPGLGTRFVFRLPRAVVGEV